MESTSIKFSFALCVLFSVLLTKSESRFAPNWESLDSRPLPTWYDDAKVGIFITWGLYSIPSLGNEWFLWNWKGANRSDVVDFMKKNYKPGFTYPDFASQFTAEFYDANEWAKMFKDSGARYIVFVTKHHDGYTNWPSKVSFNWNSKDVGPNRDIVGELATALRSETDLHLGLYHSLFEWFNPLYLQDKANGYKTQKFVQEKTMPELMELVNIYKPDIVWSDGDWEAPDTYWNSTEFLAWLYNDSPVRDTVVTNDRWGKGCSCSHGGYYTCSDRFNPGTLQKHKWENCMTLDVKSWGFRRDAKLSDYMSFSDLLKTLAETVSCGGNLLINVGPTHDGRIIPIYQERLQELGQWLRVNGEAIYGSKPWTHQIDTLTENVWYTSQTTTEVYAIILTWPATGNLLLGAPVPTQSTTVTMLGYAIPLKWTANQGTMTITMPSVPISQLPSLTAWVLKFQNIA